MTRKLLTVEDFKSSAKDGARPDAMLFRLMPGPAETVSDDSRTCTFVFSDGTVDLMGDDIVPTGWELDQFKSGNPVALFAHNSMEPPIGRASNVFVRDKAQLVGDITFAPPEVYEFADLIYRLIKNRYLNACSVGFRPLDYKFVEDKNRPWGISFLRQQLIEISVVPCPANMHALVEARAAGIDTRPLQQWAEKILDEGNSILVPRDLLEETFKAAKTPRTVRQQYLTPRELKAELETPYPNKETAVATLKVDVTQAKAEVAAVSAVIAEEARAALLVGEGKRPTGIKLSGSGGSGEGATTAVVEGAGKAASDANTPTGGDGKAPMGNCGRSVDETCGMKDPQECAIHYTAPAAEPDADDKALDDLVAKLNTASPEIIDELAKALAARIKAGRRISAANKALLETAIGHHAAASESCKAVIDSNDPTEPDDTDPADDLIVEIPDPEKQRANRVQKARELRASLHLN